MYVALQEALQEGVEKQGLEEEADVSQACNPAKLHAPLVSEHVVGIALSW